MATAWYPTHMDPLPSDNRRYERQRLERDYIQRIRPSLNTMDVWRPTSNNTKQKKRKFKKRRKNNYIRITRVLNLQLWPIEQARTCRS